jgi:Rad3-related DNA helicase
LASAASLQLEAEIGRDEFESLGVALDAKQATTALANLIVAADKRLDISKDVYEKDWLRTLRANASDILAALASPTPFRSAGVQGEPGNERVVLRVKNPATVLANFLNAAPAVIFTSGTLAPDGRMERFARSVGLKRISPHSTCIEPKYHGSLGFVLAQRSLKLDSEEWFQVVVSGIKKAQEDQGYNLVLTTSYALTERLGGQDLWRAEKRR